MFHRLLSTISLCVLFLVVAATLTVADAAEWRIAQMSGQVFVRRGAVQLASLAPNRILKSGSVIVTKKNGRVQLVRGEQTMIISPNSMIALPGDGLFSTRIIEEIGQVEYDVDHRWTRHFKVETPYLAAVVKGTRFQVRVTRGGASVKVLRGRVEVTYYRTGEKVDVLAGQKAAVGAAGGLSVDGVGDLQPVRKGQPVNPSKRAKSGLVREARDTTAPGADTGDTASVGLGSGGLSGDTGGVSTGIGGLGTTSGSTKGGSTKGGVSTGRDTASVSTGGGASVSAGDDGVSVGIGGGGGVSVSAGDDGVSVGLGNGGVSVGAGGGGVSVNVGGDSGISVNAGGGGVSVNAGDGLSVGVGRDGVSVGIGGLNIGGR